MVIDDDAEVSSTTDGSNPQLDCSLGKEVGEGRVVEIREVPNEAKVIDVDLPNTVEETSETSGDGCKEHFNIVLESRVIIKAKSVAFADAVVQEADERIIGQVHEIQRHQEFTNSDIFVPEKQKKKINDQGKVKVSLRNKTESDKSLNQGIRVCQIALQNKPNKSISKSESTRSLMREVSEKEKKHNTTEDIACLSESDIEIIEDEDICIVEEVPGRFVEDSSKRADLLKEPSRQAEKIEESSSTSFSEGKPTLPQKKIVQSQKTDPPSKPVTEKPPCSHLHLEEDACPKALLSGGECKLVNCSDNLQHTFPATFLEALGQEFCLRHLRNKVCTRALPPFLCSSSQHVESMEPVLAFYKDYRYRVYKSCPNCCRKISEQAPSDEEKDASHLDKTTNEQTPASIADNDGGRPSVVVERPLKDFCSHIKFRMKLCNVRDKAKCPTAGCTDVHAINEVLKIQFCRDFLDDPSQCQKTPCLPHFNLGELQERYHLAIRARVLNCSKCIFRCKHFNLANLVEKKQRPCADDFAGRCPHEKDGLVVCAFVHREEVQHLDLPAAANSTMADYEQTFCKSLASCKGFCKTCRSEMEEMKKEFEKKTKMEVFKPVGPSPPPGIPPKTVAKPGEGSSGQVKASERGFSSQTGPRSQPTTTPRPKLEPHPESRPQGRRCKIYWGSGFCRFGSSCRFLH